MVANFMSFASAQGNGDGTRRSSQRRRPLLAGGALALAVGAGFAWTNLADGDPRLPTSGEDPSDQPTSAAAAAPSEPPVQICDNAAVLEGPRTPPDGAVVVDKSQNLSDLTDENPAGTVFWLAPGTHTVGTGAYSQVIPKDGNTYVGAPGARLDGQRLARYAFTGDAANVSIRHLTIENFGQLGGNNDEGVVNHNAAADWVIENNTVTNNAGAGLMVGSGNLVRNNCLEQNGQYGFNAYHPDEVADVTIENNEIVGNNTDDWEALREGCGCTGGGKFWKVIGGVIRNNWVHDNNGAGLWVDTNNAGLAFEGNYISDNDAEGIFYEASYNGLIRSNTFVRNGHVKGPTNPGFPTSAVYISESGSDARVATDYSETFEISHNVFEDNWAGVILWENADRFVGSPANTSSGSSTLVNPAIANGNTCTPANINSEPYLDDCRWKTKNVQIHHNMFSFDPNEIGDACTTRSGCGYNGIFSNWGSYPDWSPYLDDTIQDAITFEQDNLFFENTYSGPWRFIIYEQGTRVDWAHWQGAPYGQDGNSIIKIQASKR